MSVDARLSALLADAGLGEVRAMTPMAGGRNNQVFRVETDSGALVLKAYFHHTGDTRDRLGAEFRFSQFAWENGVHVIPRPIVADKEQRLGLYAFVVGTQPEHVDAGAVDQALRFVTRLNVAREHARNLPDASEACFSIADHLDCIGARVARLQSTEAGPVRTYVLDVLEPAWRLIRREVISAAARMHLHMDKVQTAGDRVVSPSDFGFHNALVDAEGRYWFLDFEYAGWDDPAKLVCDFFCQQARPVPPRYFEQVTESLTRMTTDPPAQVTRIRLLWPAYQIKWSCILLNEFLPVSRERRQFAGIDAEADVDGHIHASESLVSRALADAACLNEVLACSA